MNTITEGASVKISHVLKSKSWNHTHYMSWWLQICSGCGYGNEVNNLQIAYIVEERLLMEFTSFLALGGNKGDFWGGGKVTPRGCKGGWKEARGMATMDFPDFLAPPLALWLPTALPLLLLLPWCFDGIFFSTLLSLRSPRWFVLATTRHNLPQLAHKYHNSP